VFGEVVSEEGVVVSVLQELKKYFVTSTFVRIEPMVNNLSVVTCNLSPTKNIQPARTLVVDLEGKGDDQLLAGMHQKTRYNIRLAQKHGVVVRGSGECVVGSPEWESGISLIVETASRQGYKGHPGAYYENMLRFFESHGMELRASLVIAEHGGEELASGVYIDCYGTRTYLFGGSSEKNKNLMAPYALHWQAMVSARDAGLKVYDFWGLESSSGHTAGFARFKLGFGGREVVYPGAFDIEQKKPCYLLYKLLRKINKYLK
jgi:lipid II:glycine glycyltransferase (peptidoglycan interpeptide bridge formation enzyme)